MASRPSGNNSQPEYSQPGSQNKRVSLSSLRGEKQIEVYETQTGVLRTYQMKELGNTATSSKMLWEIPVEKWKTCAAIILPPENKNSKKASVQIASVPIPLSMAVQRSIFGRDKNIYVTSRV